MSEELSGLEPDDTAAPADPGVAERLIREEFSDTLPAHRVRFHREHKEDAASASGGAAAEAAVGDGLEAAATHRTAKVPRVGSEPPSAEETIAVSTAAIHEAFAEPKRQPRSRSHRGGMLAGLGVVGVLLAVLVLLAPGGSKPRLPAQSVHDVSPLTASGPKTDAATTPSTAAPTTTSSAPTSTTTTPQPHQGETITTFITYTLVPGATPTVAPATAPSATATTAPPATTTTTSPPQTTTTTTRTCLLIFKC
ncbi:MAG TPA: hypothetical protein VG346_15875 [Acidimicrobiales bacterium]|jgi:hypothetical protein|nr:hypothetical protein [Acidimicrobiales bacterium]